MSTSAITTCYDRRLVTDCTLAHHQIGARAWVQKWDVVRNRNHTHRGIVVAHDPARRSLVLSVRGVEISVECGAVGGAAA